MDNPASDILGALCVPFNFLKQFLTWVTPPVIVLQPEVTTTQRILNTLEKAQQVSCAQNPAISVVNQALLGAEDDALWCIIENSFDCHSLLGNGLNTKDIMGKMVIQILAAIAEAEREYISERINGGRLIVMVTGIKFECKPYQKSAMIRESVSQGATVKLIIEKTGISRATYFRIKNSPAI